MKQIPFLLIYFRFLIGIYFISGVFVPALQDSVLISCLLLTGIITDIFDGVIARKLKSDSAYLRKLDSKVDTFFWFALLLLLFFIRKDFMFAHVVALATLLSTEVGLQYFAYFKFKKSLALHTYAAKTWAILLTITVLQLLLGGGSEIIFYIMFCWGVIAEIEVFLIIKRMKNYTVDVKSVFSFK